MGLIPLFTTSFESAHGVLGFLENGNWDADGYSLCTVYLSLLRFTASLFLGMAMGYCKAYSSISS